MHRQQDSRKQEGGMTIFALVQDGAFLARQGDAANCIFFVEEGTVQIYHTMNRASEDSEDEEEEEVSLSSLLPSSLSAQS